ncbi:MAG: SH3 domain-containing protein [Pseudomonadota bacterium]
MRFIVLIFMIAVATPSSAATFCSVNDPTGTPLNVRSAPQGTVQGTLQNGVEVEIIATARDNRGRPWVRVKPPGATQVYGWLFRDYLWCG